MQARRDNGVLWPIAARLVTSGPAFLVGLLVEMAVFARGVARARRQKSR
ncbi:MAG TPA: hypothetical protein VGG87_09450 [Solirubrobacteraceae bacterium]